MAKPSNTTVKRRSKGENGVPKVFSFRTTTTLASHWQEKISDSNLTASEFFRLAVEQNQTTVVADPGKKEKRPATRIAKTKNPDARRLLFLAAQTSNNCNQLAHAINVAKHTKDGISEKLVESVLQELEQIKQLAKGWLE